MSDSAGLISSFDKPPYDEDWVENPGLSAMLDDVVRRTEDERATVQEKLQAVRVLLSYGRVTLAVQVLDPLSRLAPQGQFPLLRLCGRIRAGHDLLEPDVPENAAVMVAPVPGARNVALIFPGKGGRFWGFNQSSVFDRQDVSYIYLRDCGRCFYLDGIRGLGRTYAACLTEVRRIVSELSGSSSAQSGSVSLFCVGHSAGAYAAMRFGLDLGARAVLGFSGPTTLELGERRHQALARYPELAPVLDRVPHMAVDLRKLYMEAAAPPHLTLCFGEQHGFDAAAARRMADLPFVKLVPISGFKGHGTLLETSQSGHFNILLDEMLRKYPRVDD